jgi:hypothetical protein
MEKREHERRNQRLVPGKKHSGTGQGKRYPKPQPPKGHDPARHKAPPARLPSPEDDRGGGQTGTE